MKWNVHNFRSLSGRKTEDGRPKTETSLRLNLTLALALDDKFLGPRIFFLVLLSGIFSCENPVDWTYHPGENGQLVVEAILTDELKTQEIRLSLSYDDLNGTPEPVFDAQVEINDGLNSVAFSESPDSPGLYLSDHPFAAQRQIEYFLEIDWNGQLYQASNASIPVFPIGRIEFLPTGQPDTLTLGEVGPLFAQHEQAMYEVYINWAHIFPSDTSRAKLFFYTLRTLDVNELFRPPREEFVFPRGSIVLVKKHSLNDEFAAYIRAVLMETEWQGGVFDEASGLVPTNINNGGLGFFGVCAVVSDTLIAQ